MNSCSSFNIFIENLTVMLFIRVMSQMKWKESAPFALSRHFAQSEQMRRSNRALFERNSGRKLEQEK